MFARRLPTRAFSTKFRPPITRGRKVAIASGATLTVTLLALNQPLVPSHHADDFASLKHRHFQSDSHQDGSSSSLEALVRAYTVYSMCSIPFLVDHAHDILSALRSIPGAKQLTDAFVRATFFSQFVGGDTAQQTVPLLHRLRAENKGALFAYAVEHDEIESSSSKTSPSSVNHQFHKRIIEEIIRCIDVAAEFEDRQATNSLASAHLRKTWVAIKMTALVPDASILSALSAHITRARTKDITFPGSPTVHDLDVLHEPPGQTVPSKAEDALLLTPTDVRSLKELHTDLVRICAHASQRGVRIIVDAEYSWYQPAIDALTHSLMRQFNKPPDNKGIDNNRQDVQPLIYTTCQAYLRRTPEYLKQSIHDAKSNNYALGVKLVRGAYHPHEIAHNMSTVEGSEASRRHGSSPSVSSDARPPVWLTKEETDACFNESAITLVRAVGQDIHASSRTKSSPTIGVLFGTHNWRSCNLVLDELVACGLASKVAPRGEEGEEALQIGDAVTERITLAQLYGMSDALTDYLVGRTRSSSPFVIKYVPYGALSEVIPYLSRRAIENKSVLGEGAALEERRRAWAGIRKRLFG